MKILFISKWGDALGVAMRLRFDGHDVAVWIQKDSKRRAGKGIVQRPTSWREKLIWADLIIVDMVGMGHLEKIIRSFKKPYLCCNPLMDQLELDRRKGMELFKKVGIEIPETFSAESVEEARKRVAEVEWEEGFVFKPDGNVGCDKTLIVKEKEELEWALGRYPSGTSLLIQRIVEGVEVSTEGWFNGRDFIKPFNHTFEEKRFMNGNLGPNTGCSGDVVISAGDGNKLTAATIERLKPFLRKIGYRGPCDINCIVNEKGAFALEATARLGYDAIETLLAGLQEPIADLLFETAAGTKKEMKLTRGPMIAVRMSVPPYPLEDVTPKDDEYGDPILGINKNNLPHLWLCDVYLDKDGLFKYAGLNGLVLKATAIGRDVEEARRRVYRTLGNVRLSGKQYRTDIGERVEKDIVQLKKWGWL